MKIRTRASSQLQKKAKRGNRGYPLATVAFYGPTDEFASKVAVGVVEKDGDEPLLERWFSEDMDIRHDPVVEGEMLLFLSAHGVRSVLMTDSIIGCPHEEGIDYPDGSSCPKCPYWAGRDRFTKERVQ
jgi:hypothetical protein